MKELLEILNSHGLLEAADDKAENQDICGITADSRTASAGMLFVCKGFAFKEEYLCSAAENGAVVYLSEKRYAVDLPAVLVNDVRKAASLAAAWFYGEPACDMEVVGITGTKGKTTTAYILKAILDAHMEHRTAVFSTMEIDTGKERKETHLTTPEPVELQQYFAEARDYGCKYVVMEVSSQAMKMSRVYGLQFSYGIFLNIGEDHIGGREHATMEEYVSCKTAFLSQCGTAVINRNTDYYDQALAACRGRVIRYGYGEDCEVILRGIKTDASGSRFELCYAGNWYSFSTNLFGSFNIENLAAAITVAFEMGISAGTIAAGIGSLHIPGRMMVMEIDEIRVVIDYAHNYLSFLKLYEAVNETFRPRHIHSVFGCPGERSPVRKRDMGVLAQQYADYVYLTTDDSGYEDVHDICSQIKAHIQKPCRIIPDREQAVRAALNAAEPGDVVILAGKGAETTQRIRGKFEPYISDQKVVEMWRRERR